MRLNIEGEGTRYEHPYGLLTSPAEGVYLFTS